MKDFILMWILFSIAVVIGVISLGIIFYLGTAFIVLDFPEVDFSNAWELLRLVTAVSFFAGFFLTLGERSISRL